MITAGNETTQYNVDATPTSPPTIAMINIPIFIFSPSFEHRRIQIPLSESVDVASFHSILVEARKIMAFATIHIVNIYDNRQSLFNETGYLRKIELLQCNKYRKECKNKT